MQFHDVTTSQLVLSIIITLFVENIFCEKYRQYSQKILPHCFDYNIETQGIKGSDDCKNC